MKFYDYGIAPSPRKVRLFIAEKGLDIPTENVDLKTNAQLNPDFLAKNPGGTVPVLELDDGTRLTESLAICHYLEGIYPEPNLMGRDAREQALVLMWNDIQMFEGFLAFQEVLRNGHHMNPLVMAAPPAPPIPEALKAHYLAAIAPIRAAIEDPVAVNR